MVEIQASVGETVESRPGILTIGCSNVGKRTMISRLTSLDFDDDDSDSSSQLLLLRGWTVNTKYYSADVFLWIAHLHDQFSVKKFLACGDSMVALVMVFDMSDPSTFAAIKDWVSRTDTSNFEIKLCIGNKVDLVADHPAHAEYRRYLRKLGGSSGDPRPELAELGIRKNEGCSLLGNVSESCGIMRRRLCREWCSEHNIEFIEACSSNADFDKCLSVDDDMQGVERLFCALSAHMWPGMILKTGEGNALSYHGRDELSEEESDYEIEYEILSPEDDDSEREVTATSDTGRSNPHVKLDAEKTNCSAGRGAEEAGTAEYEELEQLMSEIGNARDGLRLMPDVQRREMAAKLAMKMAVMFGGDTDDEKGDVGLD